MKNMFPISPLPGKEVDNFSDVLRQVVEIYAHSPGCNIDPAKLIQGPLWTKFPSNCKRLDGRKLRYAEIPTASHVYIYKEFPRPGVLNYASWSEVLDYYEKRGEWDDVDTYVFPFGLEWILAYTHEYDLALLFFRTS